MKSAKELVTKLSEQKLTLALAESMTGGYVSYLITKIPGASKVLKGSFVVYTLESKHILCGIADNRLKTAQGVSKEIAERLAQQTAKILKADIGAAIVGFAGPTARPGVKIGTTYLAIHYKNKTAIKKIIFSGSRDNIRKKSARLLIDFIYEKLMAYSL